MRSILIIAAAIVGLIWAATRLDLAVPTGEGRFAETIWRRTADGWEKVSELSGVRLPASAVAQVWNTHPHPLTVSLFVALGSLLTLLAFAPSKAAQKKPTRPHVSLAAQELRSRAWLDEAGLP